MEDRIFRPLVCILLAGILVCQIISIVKLPPTMRELANAPTSDSKKQVLMRTPLVHSHLSEPIQVDITDTPLPVRITR